MLTFIAALMAGLKSPIFCETSMVPTAFFLDRAALSKNLITAGVSLSRSPEVEPKMEKRRGRRTLISCERYENFETYQHAGNGLLELRCEERRMSAE